MRLRLLHILHEFVAEMRIRIPDSLGLPLGMLVLLSRLALPVLLIDSTHAKARLANYVLRVSGSLALDLIRICSDRVLRGSSYAILLSCTQGPLSHPLLLIVFEMAYFAQTRRIVSLAVSFWLFSLREVTRSLLQNHCA